MRGPSFPSQRGRDRAGDIATEVYESFDALQARLREIFGVG